MNRLLTGTAIAAIIALSTVGAQAQTALRFAHPAPESDIQQDLAVFFKEQVEERSGGSIAVQIFPSGQLGNDAAMIDGVRSGIIDIAMSGLNNFTGLVPQAGALELPFIFPAREDAYAVLDGDIGQGISDQFLPLGMRVLGYPENGYRNMTNNRGPIREPSDLSGLQMRVNNSRALNDMFQLLGATPQQIPVTELYSALETGVVDAQDHPIGIVVSFRFDEVQDYLSLTQHAYSALTLVMNESKFAGLTEEEQQIITDVSTEAVAMQRDLVQEREQEMIEQLRTNGMEVNEDVDSAAFQEAARPTWDTFIQENGGEIVEAIQAAQAQ